MRPRDDTGTVIDLVYYRIESAVDALHAAKSLLDLGHYKRANNSAYYAIFYAMNAVHALDGAGYKRHKDVIGNFNKNYVKAGIFPRELGHKIARVENIRNASDYDDFYIATKSEAFEQIACAEELLGLVKLYCQGRTKDLRDNKQL